MEPVYGNHIGFVINNNDPEGRKRVQVYIPYLSTTLYKGWNADLKDKKIINGIGVGQDGITADLLSKLKQILPWSEAAAPIFGGGTAMTANAGTGQVNVNGTSTLSINQQVNTGTTINSACCAGPSFGTPMTASSDANPNALAPNNPVGNGQDTISADGLCRTVVFNGGNNISVDTDGPSNTKGCKSTATGCDSANTVGVVVNDPSLYHKYFYLTATDTVGRSCTVLAYGYDYNPSHGLGNPNTKGPLEISKCAVETFQSAGFNISYDCTTDSANGGGITFSISPADNSAIDPAVVAQNQQNGQQAWPENDEAGVTRSRTPNAMIAGKGSPNGFFSVPNVGAKVWVFFYGGDVQKPIYFANVIEPSASASTGS